MLVIIGLLLGGILKGQEMITQAKIKNVIADFSGVSAAYHGYVDRYKKIPGDDPCAGGTVTLGNCGTTTGRWTGATAGDGNGVVAGKYNITGASTAEARQWWDHLRRSGFVSGVGDQQPFNALSGMIGVETGDGSATPAAALKDAAGNGFVGVIICSANLPDKIAIAADTQMDDGVSNTGTVRGQQQTGPNPDVIVTATAAYAETGTNVYAICRAL